MMSKGDEPTGPATMSLHVSMILFGVTLALVGSFDFGKVMSWVVPPLAAATIGIPALVVCFVIFSAGRDRAEPQAKNNSSRPAEVNRDFESARQSMEESRSRAREQSAESISNRYSNPSNNSAQTSPKTSSEPKPNIQESGPQMNLPNLGPRIQTGPIGVPTGPPGFQRPSYSPPTIRPPSPRPSGFSRPSTTSSNRTTTSMRPTEKRPSGTPGVDSEMAGGVGGEKFYWYVNSKSQPVVGVQYSMGTWAGKQALRKFEPIFDRFGTSGASYVMARDGYVLGGVNINHTEFVHAARLLFMKIKPDGSLDPSDQYISDWLGKPVGNSSKSILGNGKKVIGIKCCKGAVIDSTGLVFGE